jgi:hypothetical protein
LLVRRWEAFSLWWGHCVLDAGRPSILKGAFVRAWLFGRAVEQGPVLPGLMSLGVTVLCCVCPGPLGCRSSYPTSSDLRCGFRVKGVAMEICCWLRRGPAQ